MAIKSSSAAFTRFFVPDIQTEDFWSYVDERLQAGAFRDLEDGEEQAAGFTSWDDFFEPSFAGSSYHKGEHVAFSFRLDRRKVPTIVRKQFVRQAVQKHRGENNGKWPTRQERQEIQENVQNFLLNRAFPEPSSCDVVWSPAAKRMLLGTTSSAMMDAFLEHFENHFHIYPVPLYHAQWAINTLPLDGRRKDVLASMVSFQSPQAMEEGRFLGYEFLTWLWRFSETSEGPFAVGEKMAELHLGERIVLTLPNEGKEKVVCTTRANSLHEARTALQQGKLVHEAQLFLMVGDNEYLFTLDSALWAVKGLRTPKQLPDYDEEDEDGAFLEKMYFVDEVSNALDALYTKFLTERLSPGWESDSLPAMKAWMEGQGDSAGRSADEQNRPRPSAPF